MAAKATYERFGRYILFKKLETDALGELWRAGTIAANDALGPFVALRRLTGGDRAALLQSARQASTLVAQLGGSTFARNQVIDEIDGVPFVAFDDPGGRSLRHIVDRARGTGETAANPIPLDIAVLIAERVSLSLATTAGIRVANERLTHGALLPQFVWITDEGEVRVAGQLLGRGLIASLKDAKVAAEAGRYVAPEYQSSAAATKASEVYAVGAVLFVMVTGIEPPDPHSSSLPFIIRSTKTMSGEPIPSELRAILEKSLTLDPAARYASVDDMKRDLEMAGARQPATTFNLAFYLSTLLKKEFEIEALEREQEARVNVATYTAVHAPAPTFASAVAAPRESRSRWIAIAALLAMAIAGGGTYVFMRPQARPAPPVTVVARAPEKAAAIATPPIVVTAAPPTATTATTATTSTAADADAAKKAFEDAVNQKLQEEMLKLQANFNRDLQQKKSKNAPAAVETQESSTAITQPAARPKPAEEPAPSAAALDERRIQTARQETPQPQPAASPVPQPQAAPQSAPVTQSVASRQVREGDVIEASDLDVAPRALRVPSVGYPPPALRMRIETSVIVTALIAEDGSVLDVRILRGDARFGFNDAAMRAVRTMRFSPPVKDGKRVRTWFPQTINFRL